MPVFGVAINGDGELLNVRKAPHQADDCDGLIYKATDKDGQDIYLFLFDVVSQGEAVIMAQQTFNIGEYVALNPIWQPGSIWPDTPDNHLDEQAVVQIYSPNMGRGYITTVPTHGRTDPFIDHFGEKITWAYMRDIEAQMMKELTADIERMKEQRRREAEATTPADDATDAVAVKAEAQQLFLDFG